MYLSNKDYLDILLYYKIEIPKNISGLIDNNDNQDFNNQLLNILELAIYILENY